MEVIWCINHDATAIRSHAANYPNCVHSTEDIRTFDLSPLIQLVQSLRSSDPTCKIAIWASLECTNFSNAKNGPKVADSRTLANDMFRYLVLINPDFFWVENVVEFLKWGPLSKLGNPIKHKEGSDFLKWKNILMKKFKGYSEQVLTSADFGGVTIRKRLFLQFTLEPMYIGNPIPTHCKHGKNGLLKWEPIKNVLDFSNVGTSIFNRKKPYSTATYKRIFKGLEKYGSSEGVSFGIKYYGQLGFQDIESPSGTLTTKDRISLVHIKSAWITNPQYGGSNKSIEDPSATLIARQDKAPIGVAMCSSGEFSFTNDPNDDDYLFHIKNYCRTHGISDIFMRPLTVSEMLKIQGFPDWYKLTGTQTEQKKHIGNSVEVKVGIALFKAIDKQIQKVA